MITTALTVGDWLAALRIPKVPLIAGFRSSLATLVTPPMTRGEATWAI